MKNIMGCFENDYTHDVLEFGRYAINPNGEDECGDFCLNQHQNNFKYYGLQNGIYCFCGNEILHSLTRVPDGECKMPCVGNSNELCGGSFRLYIFTYI